MSEQVIQPGAAQPAAPVVQEVRSNPHHAHSVNLAALAAKLDGQTLTLTGVKDVNGVPRTPPQSKVEEPSADSGGENTISESPEAGSSAASSDKENTTVEEPTQVVETKPADVKQSASERLKKALELQNRADAAAKKAKEEAKRLEADRKEALELKKQAAEDSKKIKALEQEYKEQLDKLNANPLKWAEDHKVSGKEIAEFVKEGADPTKRQLDLIKRDFSNKLEELKAAQDEAISAIKAERLAERQTAVNQAFYNHVDSLIKSNPEAFQALDVVYSREELLSKANELADKNDRLALGWNADRLVEEIENDAKADPRWAKISSRFTKTAKTTPKEQNKKIVAQEEKPVEEVAKTTSTRQRDDGGRFESHAQKSPFVRHADHVARVLKGVRF